MTGGFVTAQSSARRRVGALTAARVAAVVLTVHLVWVVAYFASGHEVRDFVRIGLDFVAKSDESEVIRFDPTYDYPENRDQDHPNQGYDGQFYYYLALDPANAHHYMDSDGYRYLRPLYPALARLTALGQPEAIPWTLLGLNLLAVGLGTYLLGLWLERRARRAWPALLYGLSPGLLIAVQRDLTEPLAYGLVVAAILAFDLGGRRAWLGSALLFALAALARQTTAVFVPVFGLVLLLRGEGRLRTRLRANGARAAAFIALSLLPYLIYGTVIDDWLGNTTAERNFTSIPFGGLFEGNFELSRQGVSLLAVTVPSVIWMGVAVPLLRHRLAWPAAMAVVLNGLLFVVFAVDSGAFTARSRITLGVVLATVLLLPTLLESTKRTRAWLWVAAGIWLAMLPVVAVYGWSTGTI